MRKHQSVNIRQISRNRAKQVGYYRFLENQNVTLSELVRSLSDACQQQVAPTLQGRTRKQQNPYPKNSLPWATWIIARLGGWSGYRSQRPPGMPTLVHGLRQFEAIFLGWKLAQTQLVCTR
jgi:hypothetical protein